VALAVCKDAYLAVSANGCENGAEAEGAPELPPDIEVPDGAYKSVDELLAAAKEAQVNVLDLGAHAPDADGWQGGLNKYGLGTVTTVPEAALSLPLHSLYLRENPMKGLEVLANLQLARLNLCNCGLVTVPAEVFSGLAGTLREIDLADNKLGNLPAEVGLCTQLESLLLFKNELTSLPEEIGGCTALKTLNVFNNKLAALPEGISRCAALEVCNMGSNKLKSLPSTDEWVNMKEFKIHQNNLIIKLPSFAKMKSLEVVKLDFLKPLTELPDFDVHESLEHFECGNCQITALPPSIVNWTALTHLNCASNRLELLPPLALPELKILKLDNNELKSLPPELGQCGSLQTFFAPGNHITGIPPELKALATSGAIQRFNVEKQKTKGLVMDDTLETIKAACLENKGRFFGP
jgi:Leucine-rich repeat (LRR) protein